VSKHELAARLGSVPETLSRTLNRFVAGRLIVVRGDSLEVLNRAALERLTQHQAGAAPRRQLASARLLQVKLIIPLRPVGLKAHCRPPGSDP
jgi:hypothetical protein